MGAEGNALPEFTCHNCGAERALQHEGDVVVRRHPAVTTDPEQRDLVVSISQCRFCEQPTVWSYARDRAGRGRVVDRRLFPPVRDDTALPPRVRDRLAKALRLKRIDPDAY